MNKKPFIIAEIGNNHEGNFNNAVKLIEEAVKAGVDAVKLQTFEPDQFINAKEKKKTRGKAKANTRRNKNKVWFI